MPDVSTIRDVARKLERWRETLDVCEQETLADWMALGIGREQLAVARCWWFEPEAARWRAATEARSGSPPLGEDG